MRHQLSITRALLLLLCALTFPLFGDAAKFRAASSAEPVVGRYLVTLATEPDGDDDATVAALARAYGGRLEPFAEEGVRGFIISMRPARARALSADPRVSVVEEQAAAEVRAELAPVRAAVPSAPEPPRVISAEARTSAAIGSQWVSEPTLWRSDAYLYDGAGNIIAIGNDSYRYDGAGRLKYATARTPAATDNQQDFTYDRWGNLTGIATTTGQTQSKRGFAVDPDTNQLTGTCADPQVTCTKRTYDAAGNETGDPTGMSGSSFTWDSTNVLTEIHGLRHERYVYDANDERIVTIRYAGGFESERFYTLRGSDHKVARELSHLESSDQWRLVKDYVYRNGALMASFSGAETTPSRHYHLDHLGTPRLITDGAGYKVAIQTFWPFGGIAPGSDNDPTTRLKFTGHERDANANWPENELDYMHARYYSAATGRFLSVDPARASRTATPQIWNRYTYALNNPIALLDPDGREPRAYLLVTGKPQDPLRHTAIFVRDTAPNRKLDLVYSHGGQASGVSPLSKYLGAYNPTKDPTVAYELKMSASEVNRLKTNLDANYTITNGHYVPNEEYSALTNNCAQSACDAIVESAEMNVLQDGAAAYMSATGHPYFTFQLVEFLAVVDLIDLAPIDMDVLDAEDNTP